MSETEEFEFRHRLEMEANPKATPKAPSGSDLPSPYLGGASLNQAKEAGIGLARGGKDILDTGAELLASGWDKLTGNKPTLSGLVTGQQGEGARVKAMNDAGKAEFKAEHDNAAASIGRVGGNVISTLPVGGVLAKGVSMIPGAAQAVPGFINALRTGGMTGGNALSRVAGGGATGYAAAGLVDPGSANAGGIIGAAVPGAAQIAGKAGNALGRLVRGPEQAPEIAAAVEAARKSGYVIPPSQANPTLLNRVAEGVAGKISTAQNASARNAAVTNAKAATALGLPAEAKITPEVLADVRATAGRAYEAVAGSGTVTPGQAYATALDKIEAQARTAAAGFPNAKPSPVLDLVASLRSPSFDAGSAVAKIKELRTAADDAFRSGNTDIARASKSAAGALEDALEAHLAKGAAPSTRLPASPILNTPRTPTAEEMGRLGRIETVPLKSAYSTQAQRGGNSGGDLVDGFGDLPVAVRREDGSYLLLDGHHRADASLGAGRQSMRMHVIDAKAYDPEVAGIKKAAGISDDDLMRELEGAGFKPAAAPPDILKNFRDARELIAKTYSVEKALNRETGTIDAKKLASQLARGKPLSGDLKEAAQFASRFPKAAQTPETMGSLPQTSPLDWAAGSAISMGTANPLGMLGVAARPAARAAVLSGPVQNRLIQSARGVPGGDNALRALAYRAAPQLATDR